MRLTAQTLVAGVKRISQERLDLLDAAGLAERRLVRATRVAPIDCRGTLGRELPLEEESLASASLECPTPPERPASTGTPVHRVPA